MKYEVSITRIGYSHRRFEVEAGSELEAQEKAMDMAGDYDFSWDTKVPDPFVSRKIPILIPIFPF
jgi:hypothetical protein